MAVFAEYLTLTGTAEPGTASEQDGPASPPTLDPIDKSWAIHCSDRIVRATSFDEMAPVYDKLSNTSKIQGEAHAFTASVCAQWPWKAKEPYSGPRYVETKHPILHMGTTYDAQTSIAAAHNSSASFVGSTVLEIKGAGVCHLSQSKSQFVSNKPKAFRLLDPFFVRREVHDCVLGQRNDA